MKSGFSLEADSHRRVGETFVITTATGTLEFLAQDVASIDELSDIAGSVPSAENNGQPQVSPRRSIEKTLNEAAQQQGLPVELIGSVAMVESAFNPEARSSKGAVGLMQLMPGTAKLLGVSASDIAGNANGGAQYLRQLLQRYKGNAALALAAYNAGPGSVAKFGGVPPFPETQAYIGRVLKLYGEKSRSVTASVAPQATFESNGR